MARTSNITLDKIPSFTRYEKSDRLSDDGKIEFKCYRYNKSFRVFIGRDRKGLVTVTASVRIPKPSRYVGMRNEEFNPYAFSEVCRGIYNTRNGIKEHLGEEIVIPVED